MKHLEIVWQSGETICNTCHFDYGLLPFDDTPPYEYPFLESRGWTLMNKVASKIQQGKMEYFYCKECENWRARNK